MKNYKNTEEINSDEKITKAWDNLLKDRPVPHDKSISLFDIINKSDDEIEKLNQLINSNKSLEDKEFDLYQERLNKLLDEYGISALDDDYINYLPRIEEDLYFKYGYQMTEK